MTAIEQLVAKWKTDIWVPRVNEKPSQIAQRVNAEHIRELEAVTVTHKP